LISISIGLLVVRRNKQSDSSEQVSSLESSQSRKGDRVYADLDGDGEKEYLVIELPSEDESSNFIKSMVAYDSEGNEIGRMLPGFPVIKPISNSARVQKLELTGKKEVISLDFTAGPHQTETMFFELYKKYLLPICTGEKIDSPFDCLFYSGNANGFVLSDLDGDGLVELLEITDEYPRDGQLTEEENKAINSVAKEQEVSDFTKNMRRIVIREKGGRGRTVVWNIYSYNGKYFELQTGADYRKYYMLIGDLVKNKMSKLELSDDSLDYLEFIRGFWTKRNSNNDK